MEATQVWSEGRVTGALRELGKVGLVDFRANAGAEAQAGQLHSLAGTSRKMGWGSAQDLGGAASLGAGGL